ncbi:MAG: alpha/beta hydrolase [Pseudomonadota bacterium]
MTYHTSINGFPCADRGVGSPVLFIHGAACDHRIWNPHFDRLANSYRCIAPTLRWFGPWQWEQDKRTFGEQTHSDDLASLVEELGCGPVFVVGWSYGANVALRLAVNRPDLVSGVAVYEPSSTSLVSDRATAEAHQICMRQTFLPVTDTAANGDVHKVLPAFIDAVGGDGTFERLPADFRQICLDNGPSLIPLLNSKHRIDSVSANDLASLSLPVHVAWGGQSGPVWTIPSMCAAKLAIVRGHEISDADHIWPARNPTAFLAWLAGIIAPAPGADRR